MTQEIEDKIKAEANKYYISVNITDISAKEYLITDFTTGAKRGYELAIPEINNNAISFAKWLMVNASPSDVSIEQFYEQYLNQK
jgi:hypothetical protein